MIHDIDEALRSVIREEALAGADVEVALDAPTRDWAARRSGPTVDMYLYDIREDLLRRERGRIPEYDESGAVVGHRPPPRWVKLSYLVTAWTTRPEDEHRLLASILAVLMAHEALPPARLSGPVAASGLSVGLSVALPPPEDRSFADVWTALGGELKPSLDVVVTAPVVAVAEPAAPLVTEGMRLEVTEAPDDGVIGHLVSAPDGPGGAVTIRVRRPT